MHVRVCPECGEEYRPEIVRCADCGAELEDQHVEDGEWRPPPPVPDVAPPAEPPRDYEPLFVTGHAADLVPLADRLQEAGIAFHFHGAQGEPERANPSSFTLYVPKEERERAMRELSALLAENVDASLIQAVDRHFDPATGYRRCPACSAELRPGMSECGECGLAVGAGEKVCAQCKAVIGPDLGECPSCGFPVANPSGG